MKRSTALVACTLFDILAAVMAWIVYQRTTQVMEALSSSAEFIEFDTRTYIGLLSLIAPMFHFVGIMELFFPKFFNKSFRTKLVYGFLVAVILFGAGMTIKIKKDINLNGYVYCEKASKHMTISHFAVYVKNIKTCQELTAEK